MIDTTHLKPTLTFAYGIIQDGLVSHVNYVSQNSTSPEHEAEINFTIQNIPNNYIKSVSNFEIKSVNFEGTIDEANNQFSATKVYITADIDCLLQNSNADPVHLRNEELVIDITTNEEGYREVLIPSITPLGRNFATVLGSALTFSAPVTQCTSDYAFKSLSFTLQAGRLLAFRYNHDKSTNNNFVFILDIDGFVEEVQTNSTSVYYWFKGQNFSEALTFLDKNKVELDAIIPGHTIYEQLPAASSGPIMDFTYDAGFTIPVVEDGVYSKKYIRISDLYAALLNNTSGQDTGVPELSDRLHALEVALDNVCSSTLEDNTDAEAVRLYNVKNTYSVLNLS